jgi:hypothetical protein
MGHVQTWVLLRPISAESAKTGMVSAAASGYGHGDATVRSLMRAFSRDPWRTGGPPAVVPTVLQRRTSREASETRGSAATIVLLVDGFDAFVSLGDHRYGHVHNAFSPIGAIGRMSMLAASVDARGQWSPSR